MRKKIPSQEIEKTLQRLLSDEAGILTLLSGSLMISDFDDPVEAMQEAVKTYNGNIKRFQSIIEHWRRKSSPRS